MHASFSARFAYIKLPKIGLKLYVKTVEAKIFVFLGNISDYSLQTCFFELPKPWTRQALKSSQGQRQKKQNMIDFYRNNLHLYSTFFCTPCKNNRKKLNLIHLSKKFQNFWGFCLTSQFYPNHPILFNLV